MDKTETNDLLEECMLYFKARPVYEKTISENAG